MSSQTGGDYLVVVQAPCYRVSAHSFATEGAFAEHLRMLRRRLGDRFRRLVIAAPQHPVGYYEANKHHMVEVRDDEGIAYSPLHDTDTRSINFWIGEAPRIWRLLWTLVRGADVVHTGLADDIWRPALFFSLVAAIWHRRTTLFFVDIDFRRDAWMYYKTGLWSFKSYLLCRHLYDRLRTAQIRLAVKFCSLVMLKSAKMVADFGRGKPNVRNFFNAAHSAGQIIDRDALQRRSARLRDAGRGLELVYFGRFVPYKGLDRAVRAVKRAREISGRPFELHLVGAGDEKGALQRLARELGATYVHFHPAVPYGAGLFGLLQDFDVCVATPLVEDTPRASFDAMAIGLPILAFDISYYRDLQRLSGAVETTPWPREEDLAQKMVALDANREALVRMAHAGVEFARQNTQEIWLDRRIAWTFEALASNSARAATD